MNFDKVLVANRGEIAVRVIRTCADLGVRSVAIHSTPDADALHVRLADEAVDLGGQTATESYLDIARIVKAAAETGAQAVHPGYGFLAENAEFARAVQDAGLEFIGPSADAIAVMGEKVAARRVAGEADVPVVPGTAEPVTTAEEVVDFGRANGFPVAVKASYGGGGRGMRTVSAPEDAEHALESARREASAAFGHDDVYLERYLERARHVEVQVFADKHGSIVWLGDRDCSVQRRHQKLVEESPAPGLNADLRMAMGEAAVRLARAVGYVGAGTVEFLVEDECFYFLEMNTRIQVEHPVTELVLGVDLVAEQFRVAAGEPLSITSSGPTPRGHAIECRINAEDVRGGLFAPAPGRITVLSVPPRAGVRADLGYEAGDEIPPFYDSMIGKLVVWAPDRPTAIRRTLSALDGTVVEGVPTTILAARAVIGHVDFAALEFHTRWLDSTLTFADTTAAASPAQPEEDPPIRDEVWVAGRQYVVPFFATDAQPTDVGASARRSRSRGTSPAPAKSRARKRSSAGDGSVLSPMQGTVIRVSAWVGDEVSAGDILFVVEAMKMENPVRASVAGRVTDLAVAVGDSVTAGTRLAEIMPGGET